MKRSLPLLLCMFLFSTLLLPLTAVPALADSAGPTLISESAVLMDADTGQILFEKNMDVQKYPASITKIMTTLLAVENAQMSDVITMSYDAVHSIGSDASHIALTDGEQITMEQALYATMLPSANDAANGVAEAVGGSIENFAGMMNERAAQLGATHTSFHNANGLPDETHLTTAHDMALITREAIQNPLFMKFFSTVQYEIPPTNKQKDTRYLWSLHDMLKPNTEFYDETVIGGKTGYTEDARHTMVTVARKNGRTLIAVVMKSPKSDDKYTDTIALFDYGFNQFVPLTISQTDLQEIDLSAQPNYTGSNGKVAEASETTFLVKRGVEKSDIIASFGPVRVTGGEPRATVEFTLSDTVQGMYRQLGSTDVLLSIDTDFYSESLYHRPAEEPAEASSGVWSIVLKVVLIILGVALLFVAVLAIYALYLIQRYKRRRRKYLARKRAAATRGVVTTLHQPAAPRRVAQGSRRHTAD